MVKTEKRKRLIWKEEDFVIKEMEHAEWQAYLEKYPYMAWGTVVLEKKEKTLVTRRFVSVAKCIEYCTAPTCAELLS